jgi:hypothetical protein
MRRRPADAGGAAADLFLRVHVLAGGANVTRRWQPKKLAERAARLHELGRDDEADKIGRILNAVGHCRHCGRPLSDPTSIERGIGSDCWAKGRR